VLGEFQDVRVAAFAGDWVAFRQGDWCSDPGSCRCESLSDEGAAPFTCLRKHGSDPLWIQEILGRLVHAPGHHIVLGHWVSSLTSLINPHDFWIRMCEWK
jgi:hypothetical protein